MLMNTYRPQKVPAQQSGFLLIEILVSLVIIAFGLLALASFVTRATTLSADTAQRARAGALLADMTGRIRANKTNAAEYVDLIAAGTTLGSGTQLNTSATPPVAVNCNTATRSLRDLCEWDALLRGGNESGTAAAGLGYRGCIERVGVPTDNTYLVTVAWGSMTPNAAGQGPTSTCGAGVFDATAGEDLYRRVLQSTLRIPTLDGV